jgi:hypothetical protein
MSSKFHEGEVCEAIRKCAIYIVQHADKPQEHKKDRDKRLICD